MAVLSRGASLLLALASLLLLCRAAGAVEHVVGDVANGWDSGFNYAAWARKYTFAVGDVLVFQYVSTQHNLYEVTEAAYRSCDAAAGNGSGARAKYTRGYDKVLLAEARPYWFICDFPGHCLGGMKLAVNVSAAAGAPAAAAYYPPPDAGTGSAASPAGSCRGDHHWTAWGLPLCVLVLLMTFQWVS